MPLRGRSTGGGRPGGKKPRPGVMQAKPSKQSAQAYHFRARLDPEQKLKEFIVQIPLRSFTEGLLALNSAYARELWRKLPVRYQSKKFLETFVETHRKRTAILEQLHKQWDYEIIDPKLTERNLKTILEVTARIQEKALQKGNKTLYEEGLKFEDRLRHLWHDYLSRKRGVLMQFDNLMLQITNSELLLEQKGALGEMAEPYFDALKEFNLLAFQKLNKIFPL